MKYTDIRLCRDLDVPRESKLLGTECILELVVDSLRGNLTAPLVGEGTSWLFDHWFC
jgi:hypothetical protein